MTVGDDDKVIVWDPKTATPTEVLTGHTGQVQGAAISPDGRTLYTSSLDNVLLVWDLSGDRRFGRRAHVGSELPCCGPVSPLAPPLALSPDGSRFAITLGASTIGLFSANTFQRETSFTITPNRSVISALAWSPTGHQLAVAGSSGLVQLWNVDGTPRRVRSLAGFAPLLGLPEAIQAVAFSPDGRFFAASDLNESPSSPGNNRGLLGSLAMWRASSGTPVAPTRDLGVDGADDPLAYSRTGKLLAVASPANGVLILDAANGQVRRALHPDDAITTLAFAPDGILATGTHTGKVLFVSGTLRPTPETMPSVTLERRPSGLPIASVRSPTSTSSEFAKIAGRGCAPMMRMTARSIATSLPTSVAGCLSPEASVTANRVALSTTCALVTTSP